MIDNAVWLDGMQTAYVITLFVLLVVGVAALLIHGSLQNRF